jgi:hypothetical protein
MSTSERDPAGGATATENGGDPVGGGTEREPASWEEVSRLRAEAKRHRLAKVAAESERDQLRSRVDAQDRAAVERIAGDSLANASDIWLTTQIGDLRDEEGEIDAEKVTERVTQLLDERPHWKKTGAIDFGGGVRQPVKRPATLGEAFKRSITGR